VVFPHRCGILIPGCSPTVVGSMVSLYSFLICFQNFRGVQSSGEPAIASALCFSFALRQTLNPLDPGEAHGRQNFGAETLISHNSQTDLTRKSVQTSLDPEKGIELTVNGKNIPSQLKCLIKKYVCAFAALKL